MDRFRGPDVREDYVECYNCYRSFVYDEGVEFKGENYCSEECSGGIECEECNTLKEDEELVEYRGKMLCESCGYYECEKCKNSFYIEDGHNESQCLKCYEKNKCLCCGKDLSDGRFCNVFCKDKYLLNKMGDKSFVLDNDVTYIRSLDKDRYGKLSERYSKINFGMYGIDRDGSICSFRHENILYTIGLSTAVISKYRSNGELMDKRVLYNFNNGDSLNDLKNIIDGIPLTSDSLRDLNYLLGIFLDLLDLRRSIRFYC